MAIGVDQIAGVSTNDKATLSNICAYRTPTLCRTYVPGSDTETATAANSTSEGPSSACSYNGSDSHALVSKVQTAGLTTETLCPGLDSVKLGSSNATNCLSGFDPCLKTCGPGAYGFRQAACVSGKYMATGPTCALPSDTTLAANLDSSHAAAATTKVGNNSSCTTEWAWGTDGSGKYCVCVMKPGYYQQGSGWFVWDCQSQWW